MAQSTRHQLEGWGWEEGQRHINNMKERVAPLNLTGQQAE